MRLRASVFATNTGTTLASRANLHKVRQIECVTNQIAPILTKWKALAMRRDSERRARVPRKLVQYVCCVFLAWVAYVGAIVPLGAQDAPNVVVTSKPIHSIVSAVMAGVATPKLLIEGSASPHVYALKPSDARELNNADIFVRVSEQVEPFTARIVRALPEAVEVVTLAETKGMRLLKLRFGGHFDTHGDDDAHAHGEGDDDTSLANSVDGHVWLDPENAKLMASHLAEVFSRRWPRHAKAFAVNAGMFAEKVDQTSALIEGELAPVREIPFVVFHDAYHYFEARFGLRAAGAVTVNPEVPPGARRLSALRERIQSLGGVCLFAEPQFNSRVLQAVSAGTGAKSGVLDPIGIDVEPGPALYTIMLENLARGFVSCLGRGAKRAGH